MNMLAKHRPWQANMDEIVKTQRVIEPSMSGVKLKDNKITGQERK